jgi:hypothetical protein
MGEQCLLSAKKTAGWLASSGLCICFIESVLAEDEILTLFKPLHMDLIYGYWHIKYSIIDLELYKYHILLKIFSYSFCVRFEISERITV